MQSILVNPLITNDKIISLNDYKKLNDVNEYILYADNILEGITLLNDMTEDSYILTFCNIVYEPIDQPIYIFKDDINRLYGIKICGSYNKWGLPNDVSQIINFVDLPDYIFYSINNQKAIIAGENTETASVGNSQWQREGRKLGAAKLGIPFIYQTFYSGRDESQDTIREPNSLQVYNQLVYSIRYKTPSFVAYFENGFENSLTRKRDFNNGCELLSKYIKAILLVDVDPTKLNIKKNIEKDFYLHMINYLKEVKYKDLNTSTNVPRIIKDLPSISEVTKNKILNNTYEFIDSLVKYLYENDNNQVNKFINSCGLLDFDESKFENWSAYTNKTNIFNLIKYLADKNCSPKSYIKGNAKVGFASTKLCSEFLTEKFGDSREEIETILNAQKYPVSVIMPLRIHKISKGKLTFSPDPESGEIVAFSELFSYDLFKKKKRPVIGYCIVDTPENFNIHSKFGTKLYKALAEYIDILIINNSIITKLQNSKTTTNFIPRSIITTKPIAVTEETAVVSTYLNQTTINANWQLCFIHTHHSSWQELMIYKNDRTIQQKIDRISTKVDLIIQQNNKFMISEGKDNFQDIIRDSKIKDAMAIASGKIDELYGDNNIQFDAFLYNMHTSPAKDPEFYIENEANVVKSAMELHHFSDIAHHDSFVVIIVFLNSKGHTQFKLVYSPKFDKNLKIQLDKEFNQ